MDSFPLTPHDEALLYSRARLVVLWPVGVGLWRHFSWLLGEIFGPRLACEQALRWSPSFSRHAGRAPWRACSQASPGPHWQPSEYLAIEEFYMLSLFFCEQILTNVQVQKRMIVIPTLFVRTLKDPMSAAALKDMREMAKPVQVDNVSIHLPIVNIIFLT